MQPLPDILPIPPAQLVPVNPLPKIVLPCLQIEESTFHGPSTNDHTSSSNHPSPTSDFSTNSLLYNSSPSSDLCNSPTDHPPSSAFPSEASSALPSDSELLLPSSTKAVKQTGLLDFFSKIPAEELHSRWRKRKRDNEERDKEEYTERKRKEDAEVVRKKACRREQNQTAQSRQREKLKKEAKVELKGNTNQDSSVGFFSCV
jgi:hypothetical protein